MHELIPAINEVPIDYLHNYPLHQCQDEEITHKNRMDLRRFVGNQWKKVIGSFWANRMVIGCLWFVSGNWNVIGLFALPISWIIDLFLMAEKCLYKIVTTL